MVESLDFSTLEIIELEIAIDSKTYLLREASGDASVKYRNACLSATKVKDGKVSGFDGLADVEPLLISFCLYERKEDGTRGNRVKLDKIRAWPARVQKALFEKTKEISELDEDEETVESLEKKLKEAREKETEKEETVKNEPEVMTAGSS